ncbi:MAG: Sjogren's syndrome/scleroderma autoantigen 1 family protein [Candidatus Thorarchaeota archaeon]
MAELLRRGATMLADPCPQCGAPLMRVDKDLYCARCDRNVVVVREGQQVDLQTLKSLLPGVRETVLRKIRLMNEMIDKEANPDALLRLLKIMLLLLQVLHNLEDSR